MLHEAGSLRYLTSQELQEVVWRIYQESPAYEEPELVKRDLPDSGFRWANQSSGASKDGTNAGLGRGSCRLFQRDSRKSDPD